jgi:hypothetical protein
MFLAWSLLFGLALVGADWWVERHEEPQTVPSYEGGTPINAAVPSDDGLATMMEGGTPMPPK